MHVRLSQQQTYAGGVDTQLCKTPVPSGTGALQMTCDHTLLSANVWRCCAGCATWLRHPVLSTLKELTTSDQSEALTFELPKYLPIYCGTSGVSFYFRTTRARFGRFLGQPSRPNVPRPEAKSASAPGSGVAGSSPKLSAIAEPKKPSPSSPPP